MTSISDSDKRADLLKRGVGISQVKRKILVDRINTDSLRCFLIALGWIVNYDFDAADWLAIQTSLLNTDYASNEWCEYELLGTHSARIRLSKNTSVFISIEVNVPVELVPQLRLAIEIFAAFCVTEPSAN